ncbi:MAG: biotin/lipoyl-binding protein, partial [Proteobacteria bacterium]|nr:biotin/lipoyl-binding protein [Pseudomonadota bacterium]
MVGRWSSLTGRKKEGGFGFVMPVLLLCLFIAATSGCKKQEQKAVKERAVNVRVWTAENRHLRPFVGSIGTLNPYETVNVSSGLDGILKTIHVEEGSSVTPGQVIAEIKETDYRLTLEQATAIVKQAEAALANAKQEHLRKEALYREELVTKQQFDDVVARLAVAQG